MLRERNETYMLLFAIFDMAVAFVAFLLAFTLRFFIEVDNLIEFYSTNLMGYLFLGIVITVSQVIVFYFIGMYQPRKIGLLKNESGSIIMGTVITIFIALAVIFFLKTFRYSRLVILYFGILNIILVSLSRSVLRFFINRSHLKGRQLESILIIGAGESAVQVESVILRNKLYGYTIEGFIRLPGDTVNIVKDNRILSTGYN